jgi:hypothetical protein
VTEPGESAGHAVGACCSVVGKLSRNRHDMPRAFPSGQVTPD